MGNTVESLLAKQDIYELSCIYMRGLDRTDATLLRSVFFDDAYCEYGFINGSADDFVSYAITALQEHQSNQHMIGNVLIEVEGDEAFGEVYFRAYHKVMVEEVYYDIVIAGRYLDRYEQREGVWKMAYRSEIVDWSRTDPTNDPYFQQAPDSLFGSRLDDAVYDREARRKQLP
ncbi:nuclear transport factor 2 family protein [Oceanicoccus sagamiensis]|uniref:nuclear transport factor 2 family protein n=1 Tax=Oceanicoccus sagamiensis TaxID=716816 RepID=UPI000A26B259|nr:nuclear transport factor 2 family protein [Oceanicoccus sagamiensis]